MTTLFLAHQRFMSYYPSMPFLRARNRFAELNQNGMISIALIASVALLIATYLSTLYWTFGIGFSLQGDSKTLSRLANENVALELKVQQKESKLTEEHADILDAMEYISTIHYLTPENMVRAASFINP